MKEKKKNELLVEQEQELRNQLSLYTEKFEEFQKTLTRLLVSGKRAIYHIFKLKQNSVDSLMPVFFLI